MDCHETWKLGTVSGGGNQHYNRMGNKNSHSDHHSRAPRNADEAGEDGERSMSLKDRLRAASDSAAASGELCGYCRVRASFTASGGTTSAFGRDTLGVTLSQKAMRYVQHSQSAVPLDINGFIMVVTGSS
ncbi:hypothetical protein Bbelb_058650 [Branchiostoma belcheri]|nr:hypothetical protein Bbelb_058650 [Branchiostoma belcheri]